MTAPSAGADVPLVSVVMIMWNAERFLDEAVRSVLTQDHERVELLLCDDGSSDSTLSQSRRWAAQHPARVRLVQHPAGAHRGMSATRNLGIASCRGELVAFLDADDVWAPDHIRRDVDLLGLHPEVGVVAGGALEWRSWKDPDARDEWTPLPWPPGTVVDGAAMLAATLNRGAYSTPTCSLMVRRSLLEQIGGAEDSFEGMYEDQVLLAKLHLASATVISGARTARYRQHAASSSAVAEREGRYHPERPNPSSGAYLRWLDERLGHHDDQEAVAALGPLVARATEHHRRSRTSRGESLRRQVHLVRRRLSRLSHHVGLPRAGLPWRIAPLSTQFGYERGLPVDRFYIERFLQENAFAIRGRVLEVGDAAYTHRFGGDGVRRSDVLNVDAEMPGTTLVADLSHAPHLPADTFDCVVLTQTLHLVWDVNAAVRTLHRILKPGGVLLMTVPGITPISTDRWASTWYWSLTPAAAQRLLGDVFGEEAVEVRSHGNVLSAVAFLEGLAVEDLHGEELSFHDARYPVVVTVRAGKAVVAPA